MILTKDFLLTLLTEAKKSTKPKRPPRKYTNDVMTHTMETVAEGTEFYESFIKINKRLFNKYMELGVGYESWYNEINQMIMDGLGESDACIFLLMLASTSPKNMLAPNLKEASKVFTFFKKDQVENFETLDEFIASGFKKSDEVTSTLRNKKGSLRIADIEEHLIGMNMKGLNIYRVLKFVRSHGYEVTKDEALAFLVSGLNWDSPTKKGFWTGEAISRFKVLNFAINLIDPHYQFENGWYPVTIDSWMIKLLFPFEFETKTAERFSDFANGIMQDSSKYLLLQRLIQKYAKKFKLLPHEFQAALWVGMLNANGRTVDSFTKVLEKRIALLDELDDDQSSENVNTIRLLIQKMSKMPRPNKMSNRDKSDYDEPMDDETDEFVPEGKAPF